MNHNHNRHQRRARYLGYGLPERERADLLAMLDRARQGGNQQAVDCLLAKLTAKIPGGDQTMTIKANAGGLHQAPATHDSQRKRDLGLALIRAWSNPAALRHVRDAAASGRACLDAIATDNRGGGNHGQR